MRLNVEEKLKKELIIVPPADAANFINNLSESKQIVLPCR